MASTDHGRAGLGPYRLFTACSVPTFAPPAHICPRYESKV